MPRDERLYQYNKQRIACPFCYCLSNKNNIRAHQRHKKCKHGRIAIKKGILEYLSDIHVNKTPQMQILIKELEIEIIMLEAADL